MIGTRPIKAPGQALPHYATCARRRRNRLPTRNVPRALPLSARLTPLSAHFRRQLDRPAGNHGGPPPEMMNRPRMFPRAVDPRLQHFENEETVFGHQLRVDHLAFERGIAFVDQWRIDARGGRRREAEGLEL